MDETEVFLDTNMLADDISEHSDDDSIEDIVYQVITRHCGNTLDYDIYMAPNAYITYRELLRIIVDKVSMRGESFRNLVVRVLSGMKYRHVSVTKARIEQYCTTHKIKIKDALEYMLDAINQGNLRSIYENYDDNASLNVHMGVNGDEDEDVLHIDTSYFAITWARSPSGSGIIGYTSLKYINVINPPSRYGIGNCLFDCISWCLSIDIRNIGDVRKALKYKSSTKPIKLKHLRHIATMLGCTIVVYEDKIINNSPISMKVGMGNKTVTLVLNNKHYSVFDGFKKQEIDTTRAAKEPMYVFYDLETYFDACNHKLVPYAMSYYIYERGVIDKCGSIIKTSIADDLSPKVYDVFKDYVELKDTIVIGYNNGAFDDYVLIEILCKYGDRLDKTLIDKHNRILTFKYGYMISKDLYRFLNMSLSKATRSFGCTNTKGVLDHQSIQAHVDDGSFDEYMTQTMIATVKDYSMADVVSLKELYFKATDAFSKIPNMIDPLSCVTISQFSYKSYKKYIKSTASSMVPLLPVLDNAYDSIIRRALIGGRCDVFAKGEFHDIAMVDVCSMYPYVMMNRNYPYHAVAKETHESTSFTGLRRVNKYIPNYHGVYRISVIHQPQDNIVPYDDTDNGMYNWHGSGVIDRWVSNVLIDMLDSYNCSYTISDGYILECESGNTLSNFLEPIMSLKRNQDMLKTNGDISYNPALRECLKLIMNSLSGKMCQRPIDYVKVLTNTANGCNAMIDTYTNNVSAVLVQDNLWLMEGIIREPKVTSPTIVGCLIYDYAKQYMYDNLISKVSKKYYMDTDSMIMSRDSLGLIDQNMFGDEAGKLKHVLPMEDGPFHCVIGAKKCYCIYTIVDSEEVIYKDYFKLKGVNVSHDRRIPHHLLGYIQDLISRDDRMQLNMEYSKLHHIRSIDTMRQLAKDNVLYVLCHQIVRTLTNEDVFNKGSGRISISSRYVIKRLPFIHNNAAL